MATIINYFVFRTVADPDVVLYVDTDPERASIIALVIENIGRGVARNVRFVPSRPLPARAFGTDKATAPPATNMMHGPLVEGIPNLGPGGRRVITWGQYAGLSKALAGTTIKVTVTYESKSWHAFSPGDHSSEFLLEVESFAGTNASERNLVKARRHLESIATSAQHIRRSIDTLAQRRDPE